MLKRGEFGNEVVETLTALRDLPEVLGRIEQADRAALYQALGGGWWNRKDQEVKVTKQ